MALQKINIGTNPAGTPVYHYLELDPERALVLPGPHASGDVTMSDGTVYNFDLEAFSIPLEHADEVAYHIDLQAPESDLRKSLMAKAAAATKKKGR